MHVNGWKYVTWLLTLAESGDCIKENIIANQMSERFHLRKLEEVQSFFLFFSDGIK